MLKTKKIPMRKCLGCNISKDKKDLIRIVKNNLKEVTIDLKGKAPGRGCYICKNEECLQKAIKAKRIQAALEMKIEEDVLGQLMEMIKQDE